MTRITYQIHDAHADVTSFFDDSSSNLIEARFDNKIDGHISIGDHIFRVRSGVAEIPKYMLPAGRFTPILVTPRYKIDLPEMRKTGATVESLDLCAKTLRRILIRQKIIEEAQREMQSTLRSLKETIRGKSIL